MSRGTTACINLDALRHNYALIAKKAQEASPGCGIIAVVKADAYGHGLPQVVSALPETAAFGVATLDEARVIRRLRPQARVLLLEGFLNPAELEQATALSLDCVIHQPFQLDLLESRAPKVPQNLWLKIDTGMNRLGFPQDQWRSALARLQAINPASITLMTHFASADEPARDQTLRQVEAIAELGHSYPVSASNSAAVFNFPDLSLDWVRVGLALYGASPMPGLLGQELGLKPVMRLSANVIGIKSIRAGQSVGYGGHWQAPVDTQLAVLGIGYGDGYPWHVQNGTPVYINGLYYKLAGRVSMDMLAVEIGPESPVAVGDTAILWGEQLPVEVVARHAGTIPYVLPCGLTSRVRYVYEGTDSVLPGPRASDEHTSVGQNSPHSASVSDAS